MANKILIFGATGAVGSSLAKLMQNGSTECHLIGKSQDEVSKLSDETGHSFSVADVLEEGFLDKIDSDIADTEIKGIAYCVGSIDLKPLKSASESDFNKCMKLNLYSAIDLIKGYQDSLKKNNGSIVLFSTVAAQRGFTNH